MNKDYFASLRGKVRDTPDMSTLPLELQKAIGDLSRGVSIGPIPRVREVTLVYSDQSNTTEVALCILFANWVGLKLKIEKDETTVIPLIKENHDVLEGFLSFAHFEAEI
jgi:hypothetical protein